MNFIKRGILSIVGRPIKTIILLTIIFVIGNVLSGAYLISSSSVKLEKNIESRVGAYVSIRYPYEHPDSTDTINSGQELIDTYQMLVKVLEDSEEINEVSDIDYRTWSRLKIFNTIDFKNADYCNQEVIGEVCHKISYTGVNSQDFFELKSKNISIVEGRTFTQEELDKGLPVMLIAEGIDGVKVGETINYKAMAYDPNHYDLSDPNITIYGETDYPVEVIGTYRKLDNINKPDKLSKSYDYSSHAFMPNGLIQNVYEEIETFYKNESLPEYINLKNYTGELGMDRMILSIDSIDDIESVTTQLEDIAKKHNISSVVEIETSTGNMQQILGPIRNLGSLSNIIFNAALFASFTIMALVILLTLRDRKTELGIYLSMGESKTKVVGQIIFEVILISLIGISLAMFTGRSLGQVMSNQMVSTQKTSDAHADNYIVSSITPESIVEEYTVGISLKEIAEIYSLTLMVVLLSTAIPTVYILRINPKKILM